MLNNLKKHALLPAMRRWDSMFDSMLGKLEIFPGEELNPEFDGTFRPEVEITEQAVIVRIALAGFSKKEISVEIENDMLHVQAERSECCNDEKCQGKKMLRRERLHSEFIQNVRLPGNVIAAQANAVCSDGILTVSIPRENKNAVLSRKVEVK